MTVIAWDGKTLAADRQITSGYTKNKRITKIRKFGKVLCGVTGETKYADALFKWVEGGRIKERFPSFSDDNQVMLVVIDDKDLIEYCRRPLKQNIHVMKEHHGEAEKNWL